MLFARVVALIVGVSTFVFMFLHGSWRPDNLFLVPDLALTAVLVGGAALPSRRARPVLLAGFGFAVGVLAVSVSSYAVRGELGGASLLGVVACLVAMLALLRAPARRLDQRTEPVAG